MIVIPVTARAGRDSWLLTFACPWCRRTHSHGGGSIDQPPADGHRLSHCRHFAAPSGYVLRIVRHIPAAAEDSGVLARWP